MNSTAAVVGYQPALRLFQPVWDTSTVGDLVSQRLRVWDENPDLGHKTLVAAAPSVGVVTAPGREGASGRQDEEGLGRVVELALAYSHLPAATQVWELARRAAGVPGMSDPAMLRRALAAWCRATDRPLTGALLAGFRRHVKAVKHPAGARLRKAVLAARGAATPACADCYEAEGKVELVLLVKLLGELGRLHRGAPFALSVRTAAESIGTSKSDAHRLMQRLQADGVVEQVERGEIGPRSRRATTWRYTGDSAAG